MSIDIYLLLLGEKVQKIEPLGMQRASLKEDSSQRKKNASPTLGTLPAEFLELVKAARESKTRCFLKVARTAEKSAAGVSTIWRDVKLGVFVPPVRISSRGVAWIEAEVDAMLAAKALMSRTGKKIDLSQFVAALIEQPS
jgi:predicted DNA-binding transcriptional regulator AlpA